MENPLHAMTSHHIVKCMNHAFLTQTTPMLYPLGYLPFLHKFKMGKKMGTAEKSELQCVVWAVTVLLFFLPCINTTASGSGKDRK